MKKLTVSLLIIAVLITLFTVAVFAHSGRTDANGGHRDSSTGQYHYHHGYPAHQHSGGRCPYDYDDKTGSSSGSSGSSSNNKVDLDNDSDDEDRSSSWGWILFFLVDIAALVGAWIYKSSHENVETLLPDIIMCFALIIFVICLFRFCQAS